MAQANADAVSSVRAATKAVFEALVPSLELHLACEAPEALGEAEAGDAHLAVRSRGSVGDGSWRAGLGDLSGGQRTLLNVSLLLSVAQHRAHAPMVLLMDEIDAALDESNAARVAALLKQLARRTQVIAISHRVEFQQAADHVIRLHKQGDHTAVATT